MKKIKVGIVGGAGYTAGELIRLLINHPNVEISFVHSTSQKNIEISAIHTDLIGDTDLRFTSEITPVDLIFLCLGHGLSRAFLSENSIDKSTKIIDLGNDFRNERQYVNNGHTMDFVYGLPELYYTQIQQANYIANPGCFATAIQLGLLPLAAEGLLTNSVHVHAITGSTGAGRSLSDTSHFSYRESNISSYKVFTHQHLKEININTKYVAKQDVNINFVPIRGNFTRGIFATMYTECHNETPSLKEIYEEYYNKHSFVKIATNNISLKDVVNTNKSIIKVEKIENKIFVTSIIDNLLKGASGQAVHNMNLMFGFSETEGLKLKPMGF